MVYVLLWKVKGEEMLLGRKNRTVERHSRLWFPSCWVLTHYTSLCACVSYREVERKGEKRWPKSEEACSRLQSLVTTISAQHWLLCFPPLNHSGLKPQLEGRARFLQTKYFATNPLNIHHTRDFFHRLQWRRSVPLRTAKTFVGSLLPGRASPWLLQTKPSLSLALQ